MKCAACNFDDGENADGYLGDRFLRLEPAGIAAKDDPIGGNVTYVRVRLLICPRCGTVKAEEVRHAVVD